MNSVIKRISKRSVEQIFDQIEPKINKIIQIRFAETEISMIGMCSKCFSSGVSLVLDEESFEAICDKCRK